MSHSKKEMLRAIPPVDDILAHPEVTGLRSQHPRFPWTRLIRSVIDDFRAAPPSLSAADRGAVTDWLVAALGRRVRELSRGGLRRVLNGTGVVLHTNLGRAVLSGEAADAGREALASYVSLEVEVESGKRGKRAAALDQLLLLATGGEACMVVNNNAAAVYLVVNSFSPPGRVIVSRGELVEIGGSFRLPEILRHAAAEVIEVGTTNRTYADDYRRAAKPGDVILKVHKSNYAIEGFAHEASIDELAGVAADTGGHLVYDLGSGAVFDYGAAGVGDDPSVSEILTRGVDCVTMSGDKLLGGSQAGVVIGREEVVARLKQNPLRRAVRVDKVTIAVLQQVLREHLFGPDPRERVPALGQIFADPDELERRAAAVVDAVEPGCRGGHDLTVVEDDGAVGGGSLSSEALPAAAIAVRCRSDREATDVARRMRCQEPPLFPRVKGSEVRINMIGIRPDEDDDLRHALEKSLPHTES
jgi:L-seryl-tRNA(Ser) seleniumtransferase